MSRTLSIKNVYSKTFKVLNFDGYWEIVFGKPEKYGFWLVYGKEKNGKTFFNLKFAEYLAKFGKTLYISAEEGTGLTFQEACIRAKISHKTKVKYSSYIPIDQIEEKLDMQNPYEILIVDNVTIYKKELMKGKLEELFQKYSKTKLIIFIAHQERKEPYTAIAQLIKKLASVIVNVEGMACRVFGRVPGGTLVIDEHKAMLYHGTAIKKN